MGKRFYPILGTLIVSTLPLNAYAHSAPLKQSQIVSPEFQKCPRGSFALSSRGNLPHGYLRFFVEVWSIEKVSPQGGTKLILGPRSHHFLLTIDCEDMVFSPDGKLLAIAGPHDIPGKRSR